MPTVRTVPWWGVSSAVAAPLLLLGGSTVAAAVQRSGYDFVADTISALASYGAHDRWIMTTAFAALGVSVMLTALGLRTAALLGRVVLAAGGVAASLVAVFPQPHVGTSFDHMAVGTFGFAALAVWPMVAWRRGPHVPWSLRPSVSIAVTAVLLCLGGWYLFELHGNKPELGLAERIVAASQGVWLLLAVFTARKVATARAAASHAAEPAAATGSTGLGLVESSATAISTTGE